ncbi:MAG: terminase small subunit [Clostridia bacterium]|nr:terminase small subunit [Clostridia bacterium]
MLNVKQEKFVQNLIKGMSQREAYKDAYDATYKDESIDSKASTLFNSEKVQERYQELLGELKSAAIMSAEERMIWLTELIKNIQKEEIYTTNSKGKEIKIGSKQANLSEKMKAIDILNKMSGEYIEKLKIGNEDDNKPFEVNINVVK